MYKDFGDNLYVIRFVFFKNKQPNIYKIIYDDQEIYLIVNIKKVVEIKLLNHIY